MTSDHWSASSSRDVGEDADAGVVDQDVEPAEARDRGVDRARDLVVAADVGLQRVSDRARHRRPDRSGRSRRQAAPHNGVRSLATLHDRRHERQRRAFDRQRRSPREPRHERLLSRGQRIAASRIAISQPMAARPSSARVAVSGRRDRRTRSRDRDLVRTIALDRTTRGQVAAVQGARTSQQAAPVEGFRDAILSGHAPSDPFSRAGAEVWLSSPLTAPGGGERQGEDALMLLNRSMQFAATAAIVCAGAPARELVEARRSAELKIS